MFSVTVSQKNTAPTHRVLQSNITCTQVLGTKEHQFDF